MPGNTTPMPPRPQLPVREIAAAVEALIDLLNRAAGDADLEDNGDAELDGTDQGDTSYPEWHTFGRYKATPLNRSLAHEDAADCDPAEEDDPPEEDDHGGCEHDGREPDNDAEVETWAHSDDHPAELFIGSRPANANNPAETA